MNSAVTLAVLAGGKSKRMGYDKVFASFLGNSLLERIISRLIPIAGEVILASGNIEIPPPHDLIVVKDEISFPGPLGGMYASFMAARFPLVALVGCDMPFVSLRLFMNLIQIAEQNPVDAVIPESHQGLEPLHGVYRKKECLSRFSDQSNIPGPGLKEWLSRLDYHLYKLDDVLSIDPFTSMFINLNNPQELTMAEHLAEIYDQEIE